MKKKKPVVLLTNDDGIHARGIRELYEAVCELADTLVIAPDGERSGSAHSITIWKPLQVTKKNVDGMQGYAVKGTPADCVKVGVLSIAKRRPVLVISGVNHGPNFGRFVLYSGTVGAASEAAILGIPAVAFSINSFDQKTDFSFAKHYIRKTVRKILAGRIKIKKHTLLNINIPHSWAEGVKIIPKGSCEYAERYVKKKKGGKDLYYLDIGGRVEKIQKRQAMPDSVALQKGYITVTPISFDLSDKDELKRLKAKDFEF